LGGDRHDFIYVCVDSAMGGLTRLLADKTATKFPPSSH
jgi:hypothetical protein